MTNLKLTIAFIAFAVFIAACGQAANTQVANNAAPKANQNAVTATPAPAADVATGKDLYAKNCMICHKENGTGGKVTIEGKSIDPNDLTTDKMKNRSDEKLFSGISEGATDDGMPAFKGKLTEDQIKAVVKHLRSLQGA